MSTNMAKGMGPDPFTYTMLTFFVTPKLFVTETVTNYVWGYVDPIVSACNTITPEKCPSDVVGLMLGVSLLHLTIFQLNSR